MMSDDVLHMVLSCNLTISYTSFETGSLELWGRNDHVSASTYLLVSKRWYRIGTPLLYKYVIVRSPGQAYALQRTLKERPMLGNYIRNIRLEGAYPHLDDIFKHCNNINTIVLLFRDIMSANVVYPLCSSLGKINPRRFVLIDFSSEHKTMNLRKKMVFDTLCNAISEWTRLVQFHYPYNDMGEDLDNKRERLKAALTLSPSLREMFCSTPYAWDFGWTQLAIKDNMHLYLQTTRDFETVDNTWTEIVSKVGANSGIPNFGYRVSVVKIETDRTMLPSALLPMHHYVPQALLQQSRYTLMVIENHQFSSSTRLYEIFQGNAVLRCFVEPKTITAPKSASRLGATVGGTTYYLISNDQPFAKDTDSSELRDQTDEFAMWQIDPNFNWGFPVKDAITIYKLSKLFEKIRVEPFERVEFARVTTLEHAFLSVHGRGVIELKVSIPNLNSPLSNEPMDLLLPCFSLKKLILVGMTTTVLRRRPLKCPKFLLPPTRGSRTLETIVICPGRYDYNVKIGDLDTFLRDLFPGLTPGVAQERAPPNRFPKLREVQIVGYQWPITHHEIENHLLIKTGNLLKKLFGVDITDGWGHPFRQRVTAPKSSRRTPSVRTITSS